MKVRTVHRLRRAAPSVLAASASAAVAVAMLIFNSTAASAADAPVNLGTAGNFSVLAGAEPTNTGPSFLAQSLGRFPGNTASGFGTATIGGEAHLGDAVALQAQSDLTTAFNDAAGRTPFTNLPTELGGNSLNPGVYRIGAVQLTGPLTLNGQGDPQAAFIFQVDSALTTASNSSVVLINGASACNVFWKIGSSATLGTGTTFLGTQVEQALDELDIRRLRPGVEQIARLPCHDRPGCAEHPAQVRDVALQRVRGGGRWMAAPRHVDEPVDAHHPAHPQRQRRQHRPAAYAVDRLRAVGDDHLHRPEQSDAYTGAVHRSHRITLMPGSCRLDPFVAQWTPTPATAAVQAQKSAARSRITRPGR